MVVEVGTAARSVRRDLAPSSHPRMERSIFLSYAGRTVKTNFGGTSVSELQGCFDSHFPHSRPSFVFHVTDPVRLTQPNGLAPTCSPTHEATHTLKACQRLPAVDEYGVRAE